ncbi:YesL family protein [Amphibacillus sediminis]|uniref:YesL family protein n=1 Tax=Amphibacillus sediminis TaxID=360185 RepID=UPI00082C78D4|nr:DUF624 domain-containing protein [Amphibacillus sediminis]
MSHLGIRTRMNHIFEWIMVLAWLNTLWLAFTLLGLGLFGWAPATVAMLNIFRRIYQEQSLDLAIFKTFVHEYKVNFFKANALGWMMLVLLLILGFSFLTLPSLTNLSFYLMSGLYLVIVSLFLLMALYVLPAFTHYQTSLVNYFKYALLIGLSHFHYSLIILIALVIIYFIFTIFPSLLLFFAVSMPSALTMYLAMKVFNHIQRIGATQSNI